MNFDELKNRMQGGGEGFEIPDKIQDIRSSRLPIEEVRSSMKSEILTQLGFIIIFFGVLFLIELHPIAFSVYVTMMTLAAVITLMYLLRMIRFVKNTSHVDGNSKSSIEYFVQELKLTLEVYKTAVIGSSLMLPLPVVALFSGNVKSCDPELFSSYFLFEGNIAITLAVIVGIIASGIFFYFLTIWWADKLYGRHVRSLEDLLEELV